MSTSTDARTTARWSSLSSTASGTDEADARCLLAQDGSVAELELHSEVPSWRREPLRQSLWRRMASVLRQRQRREGGSSTRYHDDEREGKAQVRVCEVQGQRRATCRGMVLWTVVCLLAMYATVHLFLLSVGAYELRRPDDARLAVFAKPSADTNGMLRYPTDFTKDILPVPVHSHNDYWRRIPLYEALSYGCTGVEADVWLFDDDLFVGHDTASLTPQRTFRSLYVDPIRDILQQMSAELDFAQNNTIRNGVFDEDPAQALIFLVDIKTNGQQALPVVIEQLEALRSEGYLTHFDGSRVVQGAVTVVMTGNTPFDLLTANTTYRDVFFDAPLEKIWQSAQSSDVSFSGSGQGLEGLEGVESAAVFTPANSYYASVSFSKLFGWFQLTRLSTSQIERIQSQIEAVHAQGLKARYWSTPTWPVWVRNHVWQVLTELGADMLNADDLEAAATSDWTRPTGWFWRA